MRSISDRNILDEFCTKFCETVERTCNYVVVSGFVAISTGRTRGTEDIDMIIEPISKDRFIKLHQDLINNGFECMQTEDADSIYTDYLSKRLSVRYTYANQPLPEMEVKMSKDKLDEYQIKHKQKIPLTGLDIWFNSIECNIAFKEEFLKSDKDLEDAKHLRIVFSDTINEEEIRKIKELIKTFRLK